MRSAFAKHNPNVVLHFAALSDVADSVKCPDAYTNNNIKGSECLIRVVQDNAVKVFVFSSTCAVYGPSNNRLVETDPLKPANPYGETNAVIDQILAKKRMDEGFPASSMRYFNAAGAEPEVHLGERHDPETHAIPLAIQTALGVRNTFSIFGNEFDTPDGTQVRDYVHVKDLAMAHILTLQELLDTGKGETKI